MYLICGLKCPEWRYHVEIYCNQHDLRLSGGLRPFSRLVYPVPEPQTSGLGVHATVDLQGGRVGLRMGIFTSYDPWPLSGGNMMEYDHQILEIWG